MDYEEYNSFGHEEYSIGEISPDSEYRFYQEQMEREEFTDFERLYRDRLERMAFFWINAIQQKKLRYFTAIAVAAALRYKIAHSSVRARAHRSSSRSRRVVSADSGGGGSGENSSDKGDPDSSDSPNPHLVAPFTHQAHSSLLSWPRHGCCRMERGRTVLREQR
ncbi:MAG: hypothetical protein LBO82_07910 [Synergistaceae bacterium]|jgi:hypothetical protein|nr:hypothetical protein [Synergistaceae bacterium]